MLQQKPRRICGKAVHFRFDGGISWQLIYYETKDFLIGSIIQAQTTVSEHPNVFHTFHTFIFATRLHPDRLRTNVSIEQGLDTE